VIARGRPTKFLSGPQVALQEFACVQTFDVLDIHEIRGINKIPNRRVRRTMIKFQNFILIHLQTALDSRFAEIYFHARMKNGLIRIAREAY